MNRKILAFGLLAVSVALTGCGSTQRGNASNSSKNDTPSEPTTITVQVDQPGTKVNPAMWGAFFEDINFGADGGLYAQMVKNGMFEFPEPMMGWIVICPSNASGGAEVLDEEPFKAINPHFVRITSKANPQIGISNEGFRGMGVRAGESYDFSAQVRRIDGNPKVTVEIVGEDGTTLALATIDNISNQWGKATATLQPKDTDAHARIGIFLEGRGTVDFDLVSLFPQKTWKNRPGGLRADMVQALADLKPGFLRFPGGCIVEGSDLSKRYQWKNTIGPVEDRKLIINRWNYEFKHRPTPDYYQSFGLGFFEFFQLCEDIGAQPLPIINCGMACQFNSGELCKPEDLNNYIQDALDLIEFANGPASSTWGAKRAEMGHPQPFNMKMMGVGNEQWGPQYIEHLVAFTKAIKSVHPEIQLVSDAGPSPSDDRFDYLWPKLQELHADIVDQHCYANPIWFLSNSDRFDKYDRSGPKIFFGEYAAQSVAIVSTKNRNNLECAISEAAYMTGLERNADVVRMASYAPLFANTTAWQWTPNLIWVDSLNVMTTPNYYVQQMYTHNRGDVVLPTSNTSAVREILPSGKYGVGANRATAEFKVGDEVVFRTDARGPANKFLGDIPEGGKTLEFKARKVGGTGSLVISVVDDEKGTWARWILGSRNNTQHEILTHYAEQDQLLSRVPGSLENNRWYDVKVVVKDAKMDCYLDGQLVQSAEILRRRVPQLFTSATRDEKTGEVILKVVNPGSKSSPASIQLRGTGNVNSNAKVTVLSGDDPAGENVIGQSPRIAPVQTDIKGIGASFNHTFKPRSFTIIRIGAATNERAASPAVVRPILAADAPTTAPTHTTRRIIVQDDVPYRDGDSKSWRLDLAMPEPINDQLRPAIVIIHGGGWRAGSKRDRAYRDLLMHYALKGYVTVSVEYRFTTEAPMPACVEDVKCAVRWLRAHAKEYQIDPERIGAYGHSAGAHLAMMLAMCPASAGADHDGGWEQFSSKVTSAAGGSTPTTLPSRMPDAEKWSPATYISADVPPLLLIHGTADNIVKVEGVDAFVEKLKAAGAKDVTYVRIDGGNHGVAYEFFLDKTQKAMDDFFDRTLRH